MQKFSLVYCQSENSATSQTWKILPNMVFPPILGWGGGGGVNGGVLSMRMQGYPGLFFCLPGFSPYMGREERRVQVFDYLLVGTSLTVQMSSIFGFVFPEHK